MTIKIIVNGAKGKMGQIACAALEKDHRFLVVGKLGREHNLRNQIKQTQAEVVLDLTRADVVFPNTLAIIESGARAVVGTSGLTKEQMQHLEAECLQRQVGAFIVPNFSVGVLLMMTFAKKAAAFFPDVEIVEMHHPQKFDAPSSTAIKTAQMIAEGRGFQATAAPLGASRGEPYENIPIHALRLPGVVAKQSVIFGGLGEQLTILHESNDRQSFMPGVLMACEHVMSLNRLVYGLETLIG